MKRYVCLFCGHIYDETAGYPEGDIPPGTKWEELPEDWECPFCGQPKSAFALEES